MNNLYMKLITDRAQSVTKCNGKTIAFNNKFYKKINACDLLFCDVEAIYKIIMMRNGGQETLINNYKKDGYVIITFGKTIIHIFNI